MAIQIQAAPRRRKIVDQPARVGDPTNVITLSALRKLQTASELEQDFWSQMERDPLGRFDLTDVTPNWYWQKELRHANEREREWHSEYGWKIQRFIVEIEGGTDQHGTVTKTGKKLYSRHLTARGFHDDCQKYNAAQLYGLAVYRFDRKMIKNGEAIEIVAQALAQWRDVQTTDAQSVAEFLIQADTKVVNLFDRTPRGGGAA